MKKKSKIVLLCVTLALCIVAAFACIACGGKGGKGSLKLDKESVQLYVNEENAVLRATLDPADKSAKYEWSVDNAGVVELTPAQSRCTVKPLAEGTAVVTVKSGDRTATCTVNVGADRHEQLAAPSFTYDGASGVITITDPDNDPNKIGGYELHFYQGDEDKGSVAVKSGEAVDTRRIAKGEYVVRLIALGSDKLLLPSEPSESSANISVTVDALYELYDSKAVKEGANRWGYWVGEWAVYVEGYHYDNQVVFEFNNNKVTDKKYWYMTQRQYNYGRVEAGKMYKMELGINSPASGKITINDKAVALHEGMNNVTVGMSSAVNDGMLKITFAVSDGTSYIEEGRFVIDVGAVEETTAQKLATPSFAYNVDTNIITITDNQNSPYDVNYTLGFFKNVEDTAPVGTSIVTDGNEVDMSAIVSGEYYLKLKAASAGMPYTDSSWSEATDSKITVTNSRVPILEGGQSESAKNSDKWYEWHDSTGSNSGAATNLEYAYQNDVGELHVRYTVSGETVQPIKLHYNDSTINEGDVYEFKCIIISPMDGKITVNGQVFAVTAKTETQIHVIRRQPNKTSGGGMRTTITIQLGASETADDVTTVYTISCNGDENDEIILKNLEWGKVETAELAAPSTFEFDNDSKTVTSITDGNDAGKVSGYLLGLFAAADDANPVSTMPVVVGEALDLSQMVGGTYYLKIKALAKALPEVDSAWSAVCSTTLVILGSEDVRIDIDKTGNAGAINNPGTWSKYVDGVTAEFAYVDGLGNVHVKYTGTPKNDQPFKLMKHDTNLLGEVYTITLKLTVPVGTLGGAKSYITVNDVICEIEEGENVLSASRKHPNNAPTITIKFGYIDAANGNAKVGLPAGEYTLSDISIVKVEVVKLAAPTFAYDADAKILTIADTNAEGNVKRYELGLFVDGSDTATKTITVVNGETVDYTGVAAGTYTLKLRAVAASVLHGDSDWYSPEVPVTITIEAA